MRCPCNFVSLFVSTLDDIAVSIIISKYFLGMHRCNLELTLLVLGRDMAIVGYDLTTSVEEFLA